MLCAHPASGVARVDRHRPSAVVTRQLTDTLSPPRTCAGPGSSARSETIHSAPTRAERLPSRPPISPILDDLEQMRLALELGLGDYVRKNGFKDVVVGVSGGIDSALVAALAVEALGTNECTASRCRRATPPRERARTRSSSPRITAATSVRLRSSRSGSSSSRACAVVRRRRTRPHRGEPAGAHTWCPAHGALEQIRLAARRHGKQVGDVGRLRDAVRRHGRRLRTSQGRLQDRCLPSRAAPERARRPWS